jgi:hypothetical protein
VKRYHIQEVKTVETVCDVCGSVAPKSYKCIKCGKDLCQAHRRVLHLEFSGEQPEARANGLVDRTLVFCTECWPSIIDPIRIVIAALDG